MQNIGDANLEDKKCEESQKLELLLHLSSCI